MTSIDQVLDVVCDFIDAVLPNQRFTLPGLSAGGYLARGVVLRKAEFMDGLCLLVPWLSEHEDQELPSPVTRIKDAAAMSQLSPEDEERLQGLATVQSQRVVGWYRDVVAQHWLSLTRQAMLWGWSRKAYSRRLSTNGWIVSKNHGSRNDIRADTETAQRCYFVQNHFTDEA